MQKLDRSKIITPFSAKAAAKSAAISVAAFISFAALSSCATHSVGEPGGAPPVNRERIRQVIASHQSEIGACYEGAIDVRPGAMGKVVIAFDIIGDGSATNITYPQIDPSLGEIKTCLSDVFSKMKFDPTNGQVVDVSYPLFFDERLPNRTNKNLQPFEKGRGPKPLLPGVHSKSAN